MLKMALLDCAINEKCCSVDGGRDICQSHPREFAIQGKNNANAGGSAQGTGGWVQLELTDALQ